MLSSSSSKSPLFLFQAAEHPPSPSTIATITATATTSSPRCSIKLARPSCHVKSPCAASYCPSQHQRQSCRYEYDDRGACAGLAAPVTDNCSEACHRASDGLLDVGGVPSEVKERLAAYQVQSAASQEKNVTRGVEKERRKTPYPADSASAICSPTTKHVNITPAIANAFPMAHKRPSPFIHPDAATTTTATTASKPPITTQPTAPAPTTTAPASNETDSTASKRRRSQPTAPKVLPRDYSAVDTHDLVILISSMLLELIEFNDQIPLRDGRLTRFHSRSPPRIGVRPYLDRLAVHATLSPPVLLSMVYLIDRLCALYPAFTISSLTVHRFLICAATVASKGLSDSFWSNKTYAKVGGVSMEELALLELELLFRVEWRIVPRPEVLVDYYLSLVDRCEGYVLERDPAPRGLRDGLHGQASGEESSGDETDSSGAGSGTSDDEGAGEYVSSARGSVSHS